MASVLTASRRRSAGSAASAADARSGRGRPSPTSPRQACCSSASLASAAASPCCSRSERADSCRRRPAPTSTRSSSSSGPATRDMRPIVAAAASDPAGEARVSRAEARALARTLRRAGHEAVFAGGAVRDRLLGLRGGDVDIATSATPAQVQALFPRTVLVGQAFGVVKVPAARGQYDVATFRRDVGIGDGRHPAAIEPSTLAEDVQRRDFTINGLVEDPFTGEVTDLVGGRADLQAGVVRAIGDPDLRFREDALRLLRGVRFAARLGFRIEPATFAAMRAGAERLRLVSGERVRDELGRMLVHPSRRRAIELLDETALLPVILPELPPMRGCEQPPEFHPEGDVWVHTLLALAHLPARPSFELALGTLLHDVGKPPTFVRAPDRIRFDGHVEL